MQREDLGIIDARYLFLDNPKEMHPAVFQNIGMQGVQIFLGRFSNLAPRLMRIKQTKKKIFIAQSLCEFFCFIPLSLGAKLELKYMLTSIRNVKFCTEMRWNKIFSTAVCYVSIKLR